ncbi:lysozyme C-3-like [Salarias fasciatus]|uniref:lysozyme C-3-like n=1 Tax=Salarias fasciatus TaxID=181472 RepID=UPI001176BF3B|nr:lysozyme C-3-like [Salarias fasciatus]
MEVLLALVLAGFVCAAEGRTVSKCEVRQRLTEAIAALSDGAKQAGLTDDNFVAKIVCHAELASDFNSSTVNQLTCSPGSPGSSSSPGSPVPPQEGRNQRNSPSPVHLRPNSRLQYNCDEDDETRTLYGLFQLGGHLTCSDGATPSANLCGMDCSDLLDDDILDDVHCLLAVFRNLLENGFGAAHWKALRGTIRLVLQEECRDKQAHQYFAECS